MVLKRPLDVHNSPVSPPRGPKRRQVSRSLPPSSPFTSASSLFRLTAATKLPRPTSYSKYLSLRFQLVRPDSINDRRSHANNDGVYRVVQVPLNYTLGYLLKLIKFVFQLAKEKEMGGAYNFRRAIQYASLLLHSNRWVPSSSKGQNTALDPGHLYEVQKDIVMLCLGEIKSGKIWVKASAARDPYHYAGNGVEACLLDTEDGEEETWQ
ncbi:hypothetical protein AZE42_07286 [Rhizopogon vesiculosus]|uniref:Uncharacterized protein n=1 Tax=Rhizopogon vesiculosus TaxID=180088 RepID=A0A1J8PNL2_9AGAM|nr:hypothetical protein AZE42_07286 [Rhizopogon vesiculosus]